MAKGLLGYARLTAAVSAPVYTAPDATWAAVSVSICNASALPVVITLYHGPVKLENTFPLAASQAMERSGIIVGPNQTLSALSDVAGVEVAVYGIEEPA